MFKYIEEVVIHCECNCHTVREVDRVVAVTVVAAAVTAVTTTVVIAAVMVAVDTTHTVVRRENAWQKMMGLEGIIRGGQVRIQTGHGRFVPRAGSTAKFTRKTKLQKATKRSRFHHLHVFCNRFFCEYVLYVCHFSVV
jgi:hypothetical protein